MFGLDGKGHIHRESFVYAIFIKKLKARLKQHGINNEIFRKQTKRFTLQTIDIFLTNSQYCFYR